MKLMYLFLSLALCTSCATNYLTMNVQEPAPVTMPGHIKKVGVINRSLSDKGNILNNVDQALSLEFKNLDKEGSESCISGLENELKKNSRFDLVKFLPVDLKSPGAGVFPAQLSWEDAAGMCRDLKVDALYVLEMYDTDTKISYATHNTTVKTPLGEVPAIEHEATMVISVIYGFRIYDGINKVIIDEFRDTRSLTFTGRGINPAAAAGALLGRKDAVKQLSLQLGEDYAKNIIPYWIRVSRDYYVKGTDNFKIAKRRAQAGDWDGAAEMWLKETNHPKAKVTGRACYNMAIINEINGNLDEAIRWAQKSYTDYNNKLALDYLRILKNRKSKNNLIEHQNQNQ